LFSQEEQEDVLETHPFQHARMTELKEAQYSQVDPAYIAAQQNIFLLNNRQTLPPYWESSLSSLVASLDAMLIRKCIWNYNPMLYQSANGPMLLPMHIDTSFPQNKTDCVKLVSSERPALLSGGCIILHHTKERWHTMMAHQFLRFKLDDSMQGLSLT